MKKQVIFGILVIISLVVIVGATRHFLYDNFSDGFLNKEKWEIRQDPEGQPFTDEYGVEFVDGSFVFHIEQMSIGSHRTFLVPRYS